MGGNIIVEGQPGWLEWLNVNTDALEPKLHTGPITPPGEAHRPTLGGQPLISRKFLPEITAGFRRMYRFWLDNRKDLLAETGPLATFRRVRTRFLVRSTFSYTSLFKELLKPKYLREGVDRSILLEILSREFFSSEGRGNLLPVFRAEQQALELLDVPLFTACPGEDNLKLEDGTNIPEFFEESGYSRVLKTLKQISRDSLEIQIGYIKASFYALDLDSNSAGPPSGPVATNQGNEKEKKKKRGEEEGKDQPAQTSPEKLVEAAEKLGRQLARLAVRSNHSATWTTLNYEPQIGRFQFEQQDFTLYSGSGGTGLFLAALGKITGNTLYRTLSLEAFGPFNQAYFKAVTMFAPTRGGIIGGGTGLGGIIYALTLAGTMLEESVLIEQALMAAQFITPDLIKQDQFLDLTRGAAGALQGLLTLYRATGDPALLGLARLCGERLLAARVQTNSGHLAWPTVDGKVCLGFSHGIAGITLALLQLFQATGEETFKKAAIEGIAYEDVQFSPGAVNWPHSLLLEESGGPVFWCARCHGGAGIGLARLAGLKTLETPEIRQDIRAAVESTQRYGLHGLDHLCCGNAGRLELLLTAARELDEPQLMETALDWAGQMINGAKKRRAYLIVPGLPTDRYSPGFFQGVSGIGYQFLRLACPDLIPPILI